MMLFKPKLKISSTCTIAPLLLLLDSPFKRPLNMDYIQLINIQNKMQKLTSFKVKV